MEDLSSGGFFNEFEISQLVKVTAHNLLFTLMRKGCHDWRGAVNRDCMLLCEEAVKI